MRGRKPKPTAMKMLEGNPGRRPINGAEPKAADKHAHLPGPSLAHGQDRMEAAGDSSETRSGC